MPGTRCAKSRYAGFAPLEPHGVCERPAGPHRAASRRGGIAARRRFGRRLRQHRQCAQHLTHAVAGVRERRSHAEPPGRGRSDRELSITTYRAPRDWQNGNHVDGQPLGTRGGFQVQHVFPLDAEYEIRISARSDDEAELTLDGERAALLPSTGRTPASPRSGSRPETHARRGADPLLRHRGR